MILNMRQRVGMIAASLLFLVEGTSQAQQPRTSETHPPTRDGQHLIDGTCTLIRSTSLLPEPLKAAFVELTKESEFKLAEPDEEFQVGDVVINPRLPFRRLVLAGRCGENWFVHYERGGIAHTFSLVVFQPELHRGFKFIWGTIGLPKLIRIADIRKALADAKPISNPHSYW
jgi:hypothetical protein